MATVKIALTSTPQNMTTGTKTALIQAFKGNLKSALLSRQHSQPKTIPIRWQKGLDQFSSGIQAVGLE